MNKLILLLANYELDNFYNVTVRSNSIDLQGHAKKEIIDYCNSLGFEFVFENNWLEATKGQISIILTF
jgi:hypothetical protein